MRLFLALLLLSNVSFATPRLSIEGPNASSIIAILENANVPTQSTDVGDFISVKQISCSGTTCAITGYTASVTVDGSDATTLSNLFSQAGVTTQNSTLTINTLDCIDWNVPAQAGEKQEVPTCLFH